MGDQKIPLCCALAPFPAFDAGPALTGTVVLVTEDKAGLGISVYPRLILTQIPLPVLRQCQHRSHAPSAWLLNTS